MLIVIGIILIVLLAIAINEIQVANKRLNYFETQMDCFLKALNAIEDALKEKKR